MINYDCDSFRSATLGTFFSTMHVGAKELIMLGFGMMALFIRSFCTDKIGGTLVGGIQFLRIVV